MKHESVSEVRGDGVSSSQHSRTDFKETSQQSCSVRHGKELKHRMKGRRKNRNKD